jgi:hypothetical protein
LIYRNTKLGSPFPPTQKASKLAEKQKENRKEVPIRKFQ